MRLLLLILCIVELLLFSYCGSVANVYITPVLILVTSVAIGGIYLGIGRRSSGTPAVDATPVRRWAVVAASMLFAGLSVAVYMSLSKCFSTIRISENDVSQSDVIPTVMNMVKSFAKGGPAYYSIPFVGYSVFPGYMPFQWMPYLFAEWLHFDYRWIPAIVLWLAALFYFFKGMRGAYAARAAGWQLLVPVWPMVVWLTLVHDDWYLFAITVESLVAGYYLFTATVLRDRNVLLLGAGIAMCLLSRYSIVLWVPLCVVVYASSRQWKQAVAICGVVALFFIVFFWLPFLRKDPSLISNPYAGYSTAALSIWSQARLINGYGFEVWAMTYLPGTMANRLAIYNHLHLGLLIISVVAMALYYMLRRERYTVSSYLLFSLKIYMTLFYSFIQLPFKYLYMVPLMVSATILLDAFRVPGKAAVAEA
jgi:hypothetical protein